MRLPWPEIPLRPVFSFLTVQYPRPMHLKRLTLHGFKTFADKTEVQFVPGVTCIVGPNGSGKSNILDALVWCLGEQKASNLRAGTARDVIFAGSSKRRAMGMAEVSLTVENEDRFLPLDFAEITVTRRLYRDGTSEYLINKTQVRLKDVTDLFLGTGAGTIDEINKPFHADRLDLPQAHPPPQHRHHLHRQNTRQYQRTASQPCRRQPVAHDPGAKQGGKHGF